MIVCRICGHENADTASFCTECEAYLERPKVDAGGAGTPGGTSGTPAPTPDGGGAAGPSTVTGGAAAAGTDGSAIPTPDTAATAPQGSTSQPASEHGTGGAAAGDDEPTRIIIMSGKPATGPSGQQGTSSGSQPIAAPDPGVTSGSNEPAPTPVVLGRDEIACPACGKANPSDRELCKFCPSPLRLPPDPTPVIPDPPKPRFPIDGRMALAAAVALVVIVLAAAVLRPNDDEDGTAAIPSASPTQPASPEPSNGSAEPEPSSSTAPESPEPSSPEPIALTGTIAFTGRVEGNRDIWTMDADGSDQVRVTTKAGNDWDPDLTADGTRLAWASPLGIRVADVDGSNDFLLTHHDELDLSPAWSPDGTVIAFSSKRDGKWEIYLRDVVDGETALRPLTDNDVADYEPSWSPDGTQIVYTRREGAAADIYTVAIATGKGKRWTKNTVEDEDPAWSPDGERIAFSRTQGGQADLYLLTLATGEVDRLTRTDLDEHDPAWSPDGRLIAYQAGGVMEILEVATGDVVHTFETEGAAGHATWR